jgi:hypothetical protein
LNWWNSIKATVSLTGQIQRFNISLLIIMVSLLICLYFSIHSPILLIQSLGSCLSILAIIVIAIIALIHYVRQPSRVSEMTPSIQYEIEGRKFTLVNPPDKVYSRAEMKAMFRNVLVGYDKSLVSDGEIKGNAADEKYRLYSTEEKNKWAIKHREEIVSIKNTAKKYLESPTLMDEIDSGIEDDKDKVENIIID